MRNNLSLYGYHEYLNQQYFFQIYKGQKTTLLLLKIIYLIKASVVQSLTSLSCELFNFFIMLQIIEREKPDKYRKLQDANRSSEALVEQMVNGNYMAVDLYNFLSGFIKTQDYIIGILLVNHLMKIKSVQCFFL